MGSQAPEGAALLQLCLDEAVEWRQADDGRVAAPSHRPMGEVAGQTSHPEAPRPARSHHPRLDTTGGMDSRPLRREQHHGHRRQPLGEAISRH